MLDIMMVYVIVFGEFINVFWFVEFEYVELWLFIIVRVMVFFVFGVGGYSFVNYVNVVCFGFVFFVVNFLNEICEIDEYLYEWEEKV